LALKFLYLNELPVKLTTPYELVNSASKWVLAQFESATHFNPEKDSSLRSE
jgi:hypothetical protein